MKKLGIIFVIVAFVAIGTVSSVLAPVSAKDVASSTPTVQLAQAGPAPLAHTRLSAVAHAPVGNVVLVHTTVPESASLFLLGGGLISAGLLFRRRIRS